MTPTKVLPPGYEPDGSLDLAENKTAQVLLSLGSLALFFIFGWVFVSLAGRMRPDLPDVRLEAADIGDLVVFLAAFLGLMYLTAVVHELVHGIFFRLFTSERPQFGFKLFYAYAGAPDWYLPRNLHILVALAPFVLITLAGIVLLAVAPASALLPLIFVLVLNAAGAVGDLAAVAWMLSRPPSALIRDTGDAITIYRPAQ